MSSRDPLKENQNTKKHTSLEENKLSNEGKQLTLRFQIIKGVFLPTSFEKGEPSPKINDQDEQNNQKESQEAREKEARKLMPPPKFLPGFDPKTGLIRPNQSAFIHGAKPRLTPTKIDQAWLFHKIEWDRKMKREQQWKRGKVLSRQRGVVCS